MKHLALSLIAIATLFLSSCKSTDDHADDMAGMATVNATCPVMPENEVDPEVTREFMGKTVGFCCKKCVGKWDEMSDQDKQAKLEAVCKDM